MSYHGAALAKTFSTLWCAVTPGSKCQPEALTLGSQQAHGQHQALVKCSLSVVENSLISCSQQTVCINPLSTKLAGGSDLMF